MATELDGLIENEIRGRAYTHYLTTEEDLRNIKGNSLLGDIFFSLATLIAGGSLSVKIAQITGTQLAKETLGTLDIFFYVLLCFAIIFAGFGIFFFLKSRSIINKIISSGALKSWHSVEPDESSSSSKLEIIKAIYWAQEGSIDVTEALREKIVDNRLDVLADNEIASDPAVGIGKKLTITYRFLGMEPTKEYLEHDRVILP